MRKQRFSAYSHTLGCHLAHSTSCGQKPMWRAICSRGRPAAVSTVGAGGTASSTRRPSRKATGPRGLLFMIAIVLGFTLRLGRALERYWRPPALGDTRSSRNEPANPVGLLRAGWCRAAATAWGLFGHTMQLSQPRSAWSTIMRHAVVFAVKIILRKRYFLDMRETRTLTRGRGLVKSRYGNNVGPPAAVRAGIAVPIAAGCPLTVDRTADLSRRRAWLHRRIVTWRNLW